MLKIEELEMNAHRTQLNTDVKNLVEKYRTIFGWDIPEIDEISSDQLIFEAIKQALKNIESQSAS